MRLKGVGMCSSEKKLAERGQELDERGQELDEKGQAQTLTKSGADTHLPL